jgi:alpha-tubulin suppressor-like RCC1 family protein
MKQISIYVPMVGILGLVLGACTFEMAPAQPVWQGSASVDVGAPNTGQNNTGNSTPIKNTTGWAEQVQEPAIALVAGAAHVCALAASGEVSCWGKNDVGQLGYGHTEAIGDDEPVASHGTVDVGDLVVGLAAGSQHTCAILEKGSIRCWGYGGDLALGNGNGKYYTVGDDEVPGDMKDAIIYSNSPFAQLAAGDHHTCMLTQKGAIKCWGDSPEGALGYGYSTKTGGWLGNVPIGETATFLVAGTQHTCAVVEGGKVRCWGEATSIGYGGMDNIGDDEAPSNFEALSLGEAVVELAAGDRHTCALTVSGAVRCWGNAEDGVLGHANNTNIDYAEAADIVKLGGPSVQIAAGHRHTCALLLDGTVRCWGKGSFGALGYGNTGDVGDDEIPAVAGAVELPELVIQVVAGADFTCALLDSGAVQCWGSGLDGRLGYGHEQTIGDDETPASRKSILPFGH